MIEKLAPGMKLSLPVMVEVVEDLGPTVLVLMPDGHGNSAPLLVDRGALVEAVVVNPKEEAVAPGCCFARHPERVKEETAVEMWAVVDAAEAMKAVVDG